MTIARPFRTIAAMPFELGIIGAGNMAEAIVRGAIRSGALAPGDIIAADASASRRDLFRDAIGVTSVDDNDHVARQARVILLSVKPQMMAGVLQRLGPHLDRSTLLISIAAGLSCRFIESLLGGDSRWRVVRSMPNTPMLVGQGMAAIAAGTHATADDMAVARRLFAASAMVIEVPENQIDAVTAISGSGPAYFFYLVEQMLTAGAALGLSPEHAHLLATQTAAGAAKMLRESADSPAELRRKVSSPGGATQAAIDFMNQHLVGTSIVDAIKAAHRRAKELGQ